MYKDPKIPKDSKDAKVPIVLNFAQTINTAQNRQNREILENPLENCLKFSFQRPNSRFSIKNVLFLQKMPVLTVSADFKM